MAVAFPASTLAGEFCHVYSYDVALDLGWYRELDLLRAEDQEALEAHRAEYADRRHAYALALETNDWSRLPIKSQMEPTRFYLRHLAGDAEAYFRDRLESQGLHALCRTAVALCLLRASDWPELDRITDRRFGFGIDRLTDEVLNRIGKIDDGALVLELGARVLNAMRLKKKQSVDSSSSPGSSTEGGP